MLKGPSKQRNKAAKILQNYADDELSGQSKIIFEETYELVWLENIITVFAEIAKSAPDLDFAVNGYVDCSENSGEFMDFGLIRKDGLLTIYSADWSGYDDVEIDEDGDADDCYGRYDRFMEMQELDEDDIELAFDEMCDNITSREWLNIEEL